MGANGWIKCDNIRKFTFHPFCIWVHSPFTLICHPDQVTLNWWVCFWKEGPTPWLEPCVETASPLLHWETWTHTAWQRHTATGNTGNFTHTGTHTQVSASGDISITTVLIHLHTLRWSTCLSQILAVSYERQISGLPCWTAADDNCCSLFHSSLTLFPCCWVR